MQKGDAARFAENWYTATHANGYLGVITDFWTAYESTFIPKHLKMQAIDRIVKLTQTGGVNAYNSIFNKLLSEAQINDADMQRELYRKGLKDKIAMDVFRMTPVPTSLADWQDAALNIESRFNAVYGGGSYKAPRTSRNEWAMDVDRIMTEEDVPVRQFQRKSNFLSQGERDRRRREGLCYKCGKKGLAKDCPTHRDSAPG